MTRKGKRLIKRGIKWKNKTPKLLDSDCGGTLYA